MNPKTLDDLMCESASELSLTNNLWRSEFLDINNYNLESKNFSEIIIVKEEKKELFNILNTEFLDELGCFKLPELNPENETETKTQFTFQFKEILVDLLGIYTPNERSIIYFQKFFEATCKIKEIVTIHERMHAFHHFGKINNNFYEWSEFPNICCVYKEFLAQLFTFKAVEHTSLQKHFEILSRNQPHIYQTWILGKHLSKQEVWDLFLKIKNTRESDIDILNQLAVQYDNHRIDHYLGITINELW